MGRVIDYLRNTIIKQVADHGLVVWYDPDRHYETVAATLSISNTAMVHYEDSFFALRQQVEPLLEQLDPPRLVVYVPMDQADTHNALVELETAGVVMKPGQQPPARNTRLAVIARNALKTILSEEKVAEIEKQVEAGQLTLAELDAIAEKGGEVAGVISVIFNTTNPQDVALAFLTNPGFDHEVTEKDAAGKLAQLLHQTFEADLSAADTPGTLRDRLARHLLSADFAGGLQEHLPPQLAAISAVTQPQAREACLNLVKTWQLRRDLRESYVALAEKIEKSLQQAGLHFEQVPFAGLARIETFLGAEQSLQRQVAAALWSKAMDSLVELARTRQSSFWAEAVPDIQAEWALIAVSGQVLLEADRIGQELKQPALNARAIFERYTGSDQGQVSLAGEADAARPWCLLDTSYRHMERRCHHFDFDLAGRHATLEKLIARARDRYMAVGARLAQTFLEQYRQAKFSMAQVPRQVETYEKQVKPRLGREKIAYVWVDALRFEMARELAQTLADEFAVSMLAATAIVPTITEIGMAALLPGASVSATVVSVGQGKLGLKINDTILKDRKGRVDYLAAAVDGKLAVAKLDDLVPKPKKKTQTDIQAANLILVTSQEIDMLCEGDNIPLARRIMDEVLYELRRAMRVLAELGVQTIVLVADHGYLFGEEPGDDMKIDPPGGHTVDLHRRVWIGQGGHTHQAYLRVPLADFGLGDEFELVTPWNFAIFKVPGGARAYFHGGLSPQELVIPILTLTPKSQQPGVTGDIEWTLQLGGSGLKIGRFCSVQVSGKGKELLALVPPKVRVEARAQGQVISVPVTASYGFEEGTGDTQLELKDDDARAIAPNSIALRITDDTPRKDVTIYLLDAATGAELERLEGVEVAISI